MVACYVMNDYGCKSISDLTQNGHTGIVNAGTWVYDGFQCNAISQGIILNNTGNKIVNSEQGTIILYVRGLANIVSGTARNLFGKYGTGSLGDFAALLGSNNRLYFLLFDTSLHYVAIESTKIPNWQKGTQIVLQWDRNNIIANADKIVIAIDGKRQVADYQTRETAWSTINIGTSLALGNDYDNAAIYANASIQTCYIFNSVLNEKILLNFYQNRYDIFYSQEEIYNQLLINFSGLLPTLQNNIFGANAFPIGQGV